MSIMYLIHNCLQRGATAADDAETRGHPELAAYLRECGMKQVQHLHYIICLPLTYIWYKPPM